MRIRRLLAAMILGGACVLTLACASKDAASTADAALAESTEMQSSDDFIEKAASRTPWDQARMTELTVALAESTRDFRSAFRQEPSFRDQNSPNQHALQRMDESLRMLERGCSQLATRVAAGADFEETQGTARRIGTSLNDVDMWGRRIRMTESMAQYAEPAMTLFNQIAPYYGFEPPFDLSTLQRTDRPPNPDRPRTEP